MELHTLTHKGKTHWITSMGRGGEVTLDKDTLPLLVYKATLEELTTDGAHYSEDTKATLITDDLLISTFLGHNTTALYSAMYIKSYVDYNANYVLFSGNLDSKVLHNHIVDSCNPDSTTSDFFDITQGYIVLHILDGGKDIQESKPYSVSNYNETDVRYMYEQGRPLSRDVNDILSHLTFKLTLKNKKVIAPTLQVVK